MQVCLQKDRYLIEMVNIIDEKSNIQKVAQILCWMLFIDKTSLKNRRYFNGAKKKSEGRRK